MAGAESELSDNLGAMKTVSNMSDSNFARHESGSAESELSDNLGVGRIASDNMYPNQTKPNNKMNTETNTITATATETKGKRSKANYDVVRGLIIGAVTAEPGITLNGLNAKLGKGTNSDLAFPVIYAGVKQLRQPKEGDAFLFGTDAKKNEGLYLTAAEAIKNKPEPRAAATAKAKQPFQLQKLVTIGSKAAEDVYKTIEGNTELDPIEAAYKAASMVPGTVFRIVDSTGDEEKVVEGGTVTKAMRKAAPAPAAEEKETVSA